MYYYINNRVINKVTALFIALSGVALVGCSSNPVRSTINPTSIAQTPPGKQNSIHNRLTQQYLAWRGVPYKLGGNDKQGVDCSGFVHIAMKKGLGVTVPRSTRLLAQAGTDISSTKLRAGDLVFFKTGSNKRHVGIYLGNGQFIHASTSKGVMKSDLNNPYWSKHYWKSARIL